MDTIVVTGGLGFIGSHASSRFLAEGYRVVVVDNMSRKGTQQNAEFLRSRNGNLEVEKVDVRDRGGIEAVFAKYSPIRAVVHLAGQVAVTTSVKDPREDFEINACGTFNILEAIRRFAPQATLIFASTNKVYGSLPGVRVAEKDNRYVLDNLLGGVNEDAMLDFHSPYGCSKGCADQYVRDYSRIYGLKSVVCRQSCIYGTRQFGIEDQGWVAWFCIASLLKLPITVYGDGRQVRDVLFVDDLVSLYSTLIAQSDKVAGNIFNVGGGPGNAMSILDLFAILESVLGRPVPAKKADWRPGDQLVYVSNIDRVRQVTGWSPQISVRQGVAMLIDWTRENEMCVRNVLGYPKA